MDEHSIVPVSTDILLPETEGEEDNQLLTLLGQQANWYAEKNIFSEYQNTLAENTLLRQQYDLKLFCLFLNIAQESLDPEIRSQAKDIDVSPERFLTEPKAWHGVTHGLLKAFITWMLQDSYSIGSINVRLSTVKRYAMLASDVGFIPFEEQTKISRVYGYGYSDGINVDAKRGDATRKGTKKGEPASISDEQVKLLKEQQDTPQGRRDALMMCLLLDHGLRCGEIAQLRVSNFSLETGKLVFYREKVKKTQIHKMTADTLVALIRYLEVAHLQPGDLLLKGSRKGKGGLQGNMSQHSINKRVRVLGKLVGISNLSPHDCRHKWTDRALASGKTNMKNLQQAGGWNSPLMPMRYASEAEIANEGVVLA